MDFPELDALRALADAERAAQMEAYHKVGRVYLGVANPPIDELARLWREALDLPAGWIWPRGCGRATSTRRASPPPSC